MDPLQILMALFVLTIMLGLGSTVTVNQMRKQNIWLVTLGFLSQYGIMPFLSWTLGMFFVSAFPCDANSVPVMDDAQTIRTCFPKEYGLGLLLIGCMPGGTISNLICYWSKGDVALSIIMTVCSTFTALVMIPLVLLIYGPSFTNGTDVKIQVGEIIKSLFLVIIPAVLGILVRNWDEIKQTWTKKEKKHGNDRSKVQDIEINNNSKKSNQATGEQHQQLTDKINITDFSPSNSIQMSTNDGNNKEDDAIIEISGHITDDDDAEVPWNEKTVATKCSKVLEIIASVLGALFMISAIIVGVVAKTELLYNGWQVWLVGILLQWFGTGFGLLTSMIFLKYFDSDNRNHRSTPIIMMETEMTSKQNQQKQKERKMEIMKTVSLETGMQNSTLAIAIILLSFPIDTVEERNTMWDLQVIPLVYSATQLCGSLVLAGIYRFLWTVKEKE